ncbi:MAG TPA: hypothetical protein ENK41_01405, partial [Rhodobacteraceae bacterium]|nr:hypothetical protein [Paracoccaceae bacterium]
MKPVGKKGKAGKRGKLAGGGRKPGRKPAPGGRPGGKPGEKPGARPGGTLDLADNPRGEAAPGFRPGEAPLLLMPMRLEYRVIEAKRPPKLVDRPKAAREIFALRAELAKRAPEEAGQIAVLNAKLRELTRQASAAPRRLSEAKLEGDREIWLRWYPDGNFAEQGVAPPSEAETEALEAVLAHPFARDWPKMSDGGMIALWAELAAIAGPERAVHLMRNYGKDTDPEWEARIGRIVGLPQAVAIYALNGAELVRLGKGAPIPANAGAAGVISYSPAVLGEAGWMSDFATALDAGMGMKLTEPKMVDLALAADWLICVGISSEGQADLDSLLRDAIANGAFEFLRQDSPTNNARRTLAGGEMDESTTGTLWSLTGKELNVLRDDGIAADRLATALGLEKRSLDLARGGEDAGQLEAAAMIRVIGPALMDGALAATTSLADIEDTAFIELLATHVQARGILPAVRLGDGAYGILPIT